MTTCLSIRKNDPRSWVWIADTVTSLDVVTTLDSELKFCWHQSDFAESVKEPSDLPGVHGDG
ncbi:hypothetical protein QNI22_31565 [Cytophagaceae bacterium BD1B2-1]|uniref:Uncharacterized protein n=1 Tax=Xanthocytophaga agilis TaxID=3048010 RepID=A0AAE3R7S2_9BACT|nr:hypothetical protein [Xanthocytophaga agilis]MDJ1505236.1 hypothetical protein [Xanthocytophaga agilis]